MKIKFLGTTASTPDKNNDSPCFLVNGNMLFDCGFDVSGALRATDTDISKIRYIFFTHMHHDHYIGLAGLLFSFIHQRTVPLDELTIIGPSDDVERVVMLTYDFLQLDKFYSELRRPRIIGMHAGDNFCTDDVSISTAASRHPVQALAYRICDGSKTLAASGDTMYTPSLAGFFKNADALIHDSTLGAGNEPNENAPHGISCGHSTLREAADIAERANIPVLFPVHMSESDCAISAKNVKDSTKIQIICPMRGKEYEI